MKSLKLIPLFILLFFLPACHDLDENPEGIILESSIFETDHDLEAAVLAGYGLIASEQLYGQQLTLLLLLRSDMCDTTRFEKNGDRIRVNDFELRADNDLVKDIWAQSYKVIAAANSAINGSTLLPETSERTTKLVAEARFIRAFMYYHLIRLFGNIPYVDFVIASQDPIPQSNATEVYPKILEDLIFAKEHLPFEQFNDGESTRNRATKGTAAGFKASVHLTLGQYQEALEEAKWVIDNRNELDYELTKKYKDIFRANKTEPGKEAFKELMLSFDFIDFKAESNGQNKDFLPLRTGVYVTDLENDLAIELPEHVNRQGESKAVPHINVMDLWDEDLDEDRYKRSMAFVVEVEDEWRDNNNGSDEIKYDRFAIPRPHIRKYATNYGNISDKGHTDHNYVAMRFAEIYLIAAEASNELGKSQDAKDYIDEMRDREDTDTELLPLTFTIDKDFIIKERQLEMAFEFKRWYDIIRLEIGPRAFGAEGLEPQENFDPSRDYWLPIPSIELTRDPNLIQNPGY